MVWKLLGGSRALHGDVSSGEGLLERQQFPWGVLPCSDAQVYLQWEIVLKTAARMPLFAACLLQCCE